MSTQGNAVGGALFLVVVLAVVVWYAIQIAAYWKIFTKAGEAGWKSIIPFYNAYTQYKLTWKTSMFWVVFACAIVGAYINQMDSAISVVGWALLAVGTVLGWLGTVKLAKAFGKGIGFAIGLIVLQPIFMLILGFGDSQYQGPQ